MEINTLTIQAELESILYEPLLFVTASLAGNPQLLTQHAIAVEGLGKHTDFDNIDNPLAADDYTCSYEWLFM